MGTLTDRPLGPSARSLSNKLQQEDTGTQILDSDAAHEVNYSEGQDLFSVHRRGERTEGDS